MVPRTHGTRIRCAVGGIAALAAAWLVAGSIDLIRPPAARAAMGATGRPDIVVVMLDDDSLYRLRYLNGDRGAGASQTLAGAFQAHGVHFLNFQRFYVTTPVCCPSRASFLRGQYAHHTGVLRDEESVPGAQDGGAEAFTQRGLDRSTLATWLHDAGYKSILIGKYLNNYSDVTLRAPGFVPPGWDDWHAYFEIGSSRYRNFNLSDNGTIHFYPYDGATDAGYETDVYRAKALTAIATTPPDQPIFLYLAPSAPHGGAVPAARHQARRPGLRAPRPPHNPAYLEADVSDKPTWIQNRELPAPERVIDNQDSLYRNGANCLSSVSEAVVAILNELAGLGRLDNAIFILTNDNGWAFLDHRTVRKGNPYEVASRVYFVAASANQRVIPSDGVRDALVGNIDLAPTLAELASVSVPPDHPLDGVSFAPLLRSPNAVPRSDLLLEFFLAPDTPDTPLRQPSWYGIVTGPENVLPDWKYVEYPDGQRELYNVAADPQELTNVAALSENAARVQALSNRLNELKNQ